MASAARNDFERLARFDSTSSRFFVSASIRMERVSVMTCARLYTCSHNTLSAFRGQENTAEQGFAPSAVKAGAKRSPKGRLDGVCVNRLEPWETGRLSDQRERPEGHSTCFPARRRVGESPERGTPL